MNKYYTYAYLRPNYLPYYIGKGSGERCYIGNYKRNAKKPTQKHLIIKLKQNLTEAQAFSWEEYYIKLFGLAIDSGLLHNFTTGGEGASPSEATKKKISASLAGRKRPPELMRKIADKLRGKKQSTDRVSHRAKKLRKPITLINPSGVSITFESVKDCANSLGVNDGSIQCLKNGRTKVCKGYRLP